MIHADQSDAVTVHYTGTLEDGTLFDQSPQDRPLRFIIGRDEVIPGFNSAVKGMFEGESKTVIIPCKDAYGEHHDEMVETVERSLFPAEVNLEAGIQLEVTREDDSILKVKVVKVTKETVTLDANHPLAGKTLVFEIKLLQVTKNPPETKIMDALAANTPPM